MGREKARVDGAKNRSRTNTEIDMPLYQENLGTMALLLTLRFLYTPTIHCPSGKTSSEQLTTPDHSTTACSNASSSTASSSSSATHSAAAMSGSSYKPRKNVVIPRSGLVLAAQAPPANSKCAPYPYHLHYPCWLCTQRWQLRNIANSRISRRACLVIRSLK